MLQKQTNNETIKRRKRFIDTAQKINVILTVKNELLVTFCFIVLTHSLTVTFTIVCVESSGVGVGGDEGDRSLPVLNPGDIPPHFSGKTTCKNYVTWSPITTCYSSPPPHAKYRPTPLVESWFTCR